MFSFKTKVRRGYRLRLTWIVVTCLLAPLAFAPAPVWGSTKVAGSGSGSPAIDKFLAASEALYQAVNKGNLEAALGGLEEIELRFRNLPMKAIGTAEGIHALANSITELKRTSAALRPDERKWKSGAAALRLAADALAHPDKPIWHQYRAVIEDDIVKIHKAMPQATSVTSPVSSSVRAAFDQLTEHYRLIRTAAMLQSEPWKVERSDSVVRYAGRIYDADSPSAELLLGTIPPLREALNGLFPGKEASTAIVPPVNVVPPSWGWSAMMGSFIVTILTWVGWRRYKVDEYAGKDRRTSAKREDAAQKWLNKWKNNP
ncbi:sporulation protein YpjB [Cohnella cholangitidis]|uniref:sporulation protein YpjB n=1 Tax=Cohnella cholangitidis TaxID=2598458 RepID=UPI0015FC69D5|nr:sporulation protein YpjB [Cohnella cholangitidis]